MRIWQQNASDHAVCGIPLILFFLCASLQRRFLLVCILEDVDSLVQAFCFVFVFFKTLDIFRLAS